MRKKRHLSVVESITPKNSLIKIIIYLSKYRKENCERVKKISKLTEEVSPQFDILVADHPFSQN